MSSSTSSPAGRSAAGGGWLVVGLLCGPALWLAALEGAYVVATRWCPQGRGLTHAIVGLAAMLASAAAFVTWRAGRNHRELRERLESGGWQAWIAVSALCLGLGFAVALVSMEVPLWMLPRCGNG